MSPWPWNEHEPMLPAGRRSPILPQTHPTVLYRRTQDTNFDSPPTTDGTASDHDHHVTTSPPGSMAPYNQQDTPWRPSSTSTSAASAGMRQTNPPSTNGEKQSPPHRVDNHPWHGVCASIAANARTDRDRSFSEFTEAVMRPRACSLALSYRFAQPSCSNRTDSLQRAPIPTYSN